MTLQRRRTRGSRRHSAAGLLALITAAGLMTACAGSAQAPPMAHSQEQLDAQIQVPPGHVVALETTAVGLLQYECRPQAQAGSGGFGWELLSVHAELMDRTGRPMVQYAAPPPTWTHMDGSSLRGDLLAVAPRPGSARLPHQLSRAMPGEVPGALSRISYIQRLKTKGGQDVGRPCTPAHVGERIILPYQADYVFWQPG